jgi:capsular polysaccharide transport system permease protein
VQNFILSRDALKLLGEKIDLRAFFLDPKGDIFNRFPGLDWWNNSFEDFALYYQNKVVALELDNISSISTLTVRAFTADDAMFINRQLLELGEILVNQLNERGRRDMIRFAASEYASAEKIAKAATLALAEYRDQKIVINPEQQSNIQLQQVAKLQDELVAALAQLRQLQTFATSNPQIPSLQQRVQNLRHEITAATMEMAGGAKSLANKAVEYERLVVERDFADKQLASAMASLEQAKNEAQRQQLYLERIVQPSKPDVAMEPRRIRGTFAVFLSSFVLFGILSTLFAGIREHRS